MTAFELPIPGQSLTTEPKAAPYESPPEFDNLQDVIKMHMDNLSRKEAIEDIVFFIKKGMDIKSLNEGILRSAVLEGQHSIDNSINVAPITHERIVGIANAAGLDFDEGFEDPQMERATKVARRISDIQEMINQGEGQPMDSEVDMAMFEDENMQEDIMPTAPQQEPQLPPAEVEPSQGLMSRRA